MRAIEQVDLALDSPPANRIGLVVAGSYRLDHYIGSGGSGHVFRAEHLRLGKSFAVKLLRDVDSRRAIERFRREVRALARLRSEYVVTVVDCGELPDQTPYLVMELLEGEDLRSLLSREGALPARRAVSLVREACQGVVDVHEAGVVHRDLKPENLFVTRRANGSDWCKVLDFGVAKMASTLTTAQGAIIGTVRYMAPEQLADGAAAGPAADIYALGAILYECLGGQPPHGGESIQELMFSVMNREPTALSELRPSLPRTLAELVHCCLCKSPTQRPQQASKLLGLLVAIAEDGPPRPGADVTLAECSGVLPATTTTRHQAPLWWLPAIALTSAAVTWLAMPLGGERSPTAAASAGELHSKPTSGPASPPLPSIAARLEPMSPPPAQTRPAVPSAAAPASPPAPTLVSSNHPPPAPAGRRSKAAPASVASVPNPQRLPMGLDAANPYGD